MDSAPRAVWTPRDFLDLGGGDAVDKTLQRLVKVGVLRRIDRGLYDQSAHNRLTGKPNPPDPHSVIDAIARRDQIRVLVDGMTAANDLGLDLRVANVITAAPRRSFWNRVVILHRLRLVRAPAQTLRRGPADFASLLRSASPDGVAHRP